MPSSKKKLTSKQTKKQKNKGKTKRISVGGGGRSQRETGAHFQRK